jgi:ribosome-binding ATPase YchF (GTP1/OBG family)
MEMYGMQESGLNRLLHSAYKTLDLVTYFTAGEQEARGWTVRRDTSMPDAAGVIHTDMRDGFIKAEVVRCDDFIAHGGWTGSKGAGVMALKGKADKVQDGDVCMFRFNV